MNERLTNAYVVCTCSMYYSCTLYSRVCNSVCENYIPRMYNTYLPLPCGGEINRYLPVIYRDARTKLLKNHEREKRTRPEHTIDG